MSPADDWALGQNLVDVREEERRAFAEQHIPALQQGFLETGYLPVCSCGWTGTRVMVATQAWAFVGAHLDGAAKALREADGARAGSGAPDPKPASRRGNRARRIVDPGAGRAAHAVGDECVACGGPPANAHHVLPRGLGGDDVPANLIMLCGSGSTGCHGAVHGAGYVNERGRRWTTEDVCRAIGRSIAARPATIAYVLAKLGDVPGHDFLLRRYYLELELGDLAGLTV